MTGYTDRNQAGIILGNALADLVTPRGIIVLALPRGGVPVAHQVARLLEAPMDVLVVRKIGAPGHPELACGAIASGGIVQWNDSVLETLGLNEHDLEDIREEEERELRQREMTLRSPDTPQLDIKGKAVILVDDGLATGASMKAAIMAVRTMGPDTITAAFPVGPEQTCHELEQLGVRVMCPLKIENRRFSSVGQWYEDFSQVSSEECKRLLSENRFRLSAHHQRSVHRKHA
jgi:putative phosphoribosyl transferase